MGDRFYEQQKKYKPKRRLKKDIIQDVEEWVGADLPGIDKMTIPNIENLFDKIQRKYYEN